MSLCRCVPLCNNFDYEQAYALHLRGLLIPDLKILLCPDSQEEKRQWLDKLEVAG